MIEDMTFGAYLEWRGASDPQAKAFLAKSDREALEHRSWAEMMRLFTEDRRAPDYILQARQLHMEFARQTGAR